MTEGVALDIPKTWAWSTIGDVVQDRVEQSEPRGVDAFLYVDISSIDTSSKKIVAPKTISASEAPSRARQRIRPYDVLVSMTRPNLNAVAIVPDDFENSVGTTGFDVLRARYVEPRWLFYFVQTSDFVESMSMLVQGALYPAIRTKDIRGYRIPIAPISEQRRIVEEIEKQFTRLDAAVLALKRVQANLKRYRAAVLKAACEGRLVPTEAELARREGRSYEPASTLLERLLAQRRSHWEATQLAKFADQKKQPGDEAWKRRYKEPNVGSAVKLPHLPNGWLWISVEAMSTKVVDGVHKKPHYVSEGIPFVTVKNLTAGPGISFEHLHYVTEDDHREFIRRADPEENDLLITKDGTLGVVRKIRTKREFSIFVSVAMIKPVLREMSDYVELALSSPQVQSQMVPKGSGLQHIHLEDLRQDCIPVPPLIEQERIAMEVARRVSVIDATERELEIELTRAARLRQSIIKRAFEGKLVSQDPSDESGCILLERIRAQRDAEHKNGPTSPLKRRKREATRVA